jgi:hypothetical protein
MPLTIAQPVKGTAPAPHVRDAVLRLTASVDHDEAAPRVRIDSTRGSLRTFRGRVANPHGKGVAAAARCCTSTATRSASAPRSGDVALVQRHVSEGAR